ncbi:acyl-CoA thioesterase [Phormidesmis sp. 146-35]
MSFTHERIVRFQDTDAAGVVYFANVLTICHEAYEASLMAVEINLKGFFSGSKTAVPIVHADVDFFRPMYCGDRLSIQLTPRAISDSEFEIFYEIRLTNQEQSTCKAHTRHVCIHLESRSRHPLLSDLNSWLKAFA